MNGEDMVRKLWHALGEILQQADDEREKAGAKVEATGPVEYPPIKFGHQIVVNTPGRPLQGRTQFAAIVTATHSETVCSAYVIPPGQPPIHLAELEREDTIDRTNKPNQASWQFTS